MPLLLQPRRRPHPHPMTVAEEAPCSRRTTNRYLFQLGLNKWAFGFKSKEIGLLNKKKKKKKKWGFKKKKKKKKKKK